MQNATANLAALQITQPELASRLRGISLQAMTWLLARDGYLTAQQANGQWISGCSVPFKTAEVLLKPLTSDAPMSCYLMPTHAAQIRVALDRLGRSQAIIVLMTDLDLLRVFLACDDFSREISQSRIWFACGADWAGQFRATFATQPGLCTPTQFIRTRFAEPAEVDPQIEQSQKIIAEVVAERAASISRIRRADCGLRAGACVLAGSSFRLWDSASNVLKQMLLQTDAPVTSLDIDDPMQASAMALTMAAAEKTSIFAANLGRSDLPDTVSDACRWVCWITSGRIPKFSVQHPHDVLLLADPAWGLLARAAGWPDSALRIAGWPPLPLGRPVDLPHVALLADTLPVVPGKQLKDYSSHRLLWEKIEAELRANPFVLQGDARTFLLSQQQQLDITDSLLDASSFIDNLMLPLFQQGLAQAMVSAGIPLKLYGCGWEQIPALAPYAAGPIESESAFNSAICQACAVVYAWPMPVAHPIDRIASRPVIRPAGHRAAFIAGARQAISGQSGTKKSDAHKLSPILLSELISPLPVVR